MNLKKRIESKIKELAAQLEEPGNLKKRIESNKHIS